MSSVILTLSHGVMMYHSVHPAVQQALLTPLLLTLRHTLDPSSPECALLDLVAPLPPTAPTAPTAPIAPTPHEHHSSLRVCVDTTHAEGPDGPQTPSSRAEYNQFTPLAQAPKAIHDSNSSKLERECVSECVSEEKREEEASSDGEWKFCNVCRDVGDLRCSRCKAVHYCR